MCSESVEGSTNLNYYLSLLKIISDHSIMVYLICKFYSIHEVWLKICKGINISKKNQMNSYPDRPNRNVHIYFPKVPYMAFITNFNLLKLQQAAIF